MDRLMDEASPAAIAGAAVRAGVRWIARELGPDVPLHFSAFHPDYKMGDIPPTPPATLTRARQIALDAGLRFVYTGNVHDIKGGSTWCPSCLAPLIMRDWYRIDDYRLRPDGHCPDCGTPIPGIFDTDHPLAACGERLPLKIN